MITSHKASLFLMLTAVLSFAALPGCDSGSTDQADDSHATVHDDDHAYDHDGHEHGDHDHAEHDHGEEGHNHDFESLSEAVAEIESLNTKISSMLAKGDLSDGHEPLHHIGEVLIATENFIKANDLGEKQEDVAAAIDSLLEDYTEIDNQLHGESDDADASKKFEELSKSIEESIETLKSATE